MRGVVKVMLDISRHNLDIESLKSPLVAMFSFRPNLDTKGRLIRGSAALAMIVAAILTWPHSRVATVALAVSAAFVAVEAARGWCLLRACGVKTKF